MRTILFTSRKGGAGKSTLAEHIGVEAERAGQGPVCFIDLDPMQGLGEWWDRRAEPTPHIITLQGMKLRAVLGILERGGYKTVIIDTAASVGPVVTEAVALASQMEGDHRCR